MNKTVLFVLALFTSGLYAADTKEPAALYQQHCTGCHGSEVMTRTDRRVQDLAQLESQVRQCDSGLGLNWFDDDIEAMAAYLNTTYYHFKPAP